MASIIHLSTLLDIMIMMLLDHLGLSQMTGYVNKFDENKTTLSLMVKDKQLLKNCNEIWKKIERLMSIDFNSKITYGDDDKYIKTKKNKNILRHYNYKFS